LFKFKLFGKLDNGYIIYAGELFVTLLLLLGLLVLPSLPTPAILPDYISIVVGGAFG
jgi:hypothetical protein